MSKSKDEGKDKNFLDKILDVAESGIAAAESVLPGAQSPTPDDDDDIIDVDTHQSWQWRQTKEPVAGAIRDFMSWHAFQTDNTALCGQVFPLQQLMVVEMSSQGHGPACFGCMLRVQAIAARQAEILGAE